MLLCVEHRTSVNCCAVATPINLLQNYLFLRLCYSVPQIYIRFYIFSQNYSLVCISFFRNFLRYLLHLRRAGWGISGSIYHYVDNTPCLFVYSLWLLRFVVCGLCSSPVRVIFNLSDEQGEMPLSSSPVWYANRLQCRCSSISYSSLIMTPCFILSASE